jgi:hypothetical protein
MTQFDKSKFYLGALCRRGHEWKNSGLSLRYASNMMKNGKTGPCKKCLLITDKKNYSKEKRAIYRHNNRNKINANKRKAYRKNKAEKCKCGCNQSVTKNHKFISGHNSRLRPRMHETEKKQKAREYNKLYEQKNPDKVYAWKSKYYNKIKAQLGYKEKQLKNYYKHKDRLSNCYIKSLYRQQGFDNNLITQDLIDIKRIIIMIKRQQKHLKERIENELTLRSI